MKPEENVKMVADMMELATAKLPQLISNLIQTVYSPEAGRRLGEAVGAFYAGLVNSGIPAPDALRMAEDYAKSLRDIGSAAAGSGSGGFMPGAGGFMPGSGGFAWGQRKSGPKAADQEKSDKGLVPGTTDEAPKASEG